MFNDAVTHDFAIAKPSMRLQVVGFPTHDDLFINRRGCYIELAFFPAWKRFKCMEESTGSYIL